MIQIQEQTEEDKADLYHQLSIISANGAFIGTSLREENRYKTCQCKNVEVETYRTLVLRSQIS